MSKIPSPTIVRSKRRSLAMQVLPNATLVVKAPFWMPDLMVHTFVDKNHEWIEKKLQKIQKAKQLQIKSDKQFLFLGILHPIIFGNYQVITAKDGQIFFPQALQFRLKKELGSWVVQQAKKIISRQTEYFAKEMGVVYKSISFSDTKSRWGSCTHDNHLQFNWRLIMAPLLVVNYVIIHELAHIDEKNHSMDFWRRVGKYNPSYRQNRKWLKEHGDLLFAHV